MYDCLSPLSYSISVFIIVLISGCAVNLLKQHYIFQLAGIAFFFTFSVAKAGELLKQDIKTSFADIYAALLPSLLGISACLISMVLGFWVFPIIRRRIK